jgi:hypothetical protein
VGKHPYMPAQHSPLRARRAAQRQLVCIHWARSAEDRRIDGGMELETVMVHAADSSESSQLHPSQIAYRNRAGSWKQQRQFPPKKSLQT